MKNKFIPILLTALATISLTSCARPDKTERPSYKTDKLLQLNSCADFKEAFVKSFTEDLLYNNSFIPFTPYISILQSPTPSVQDAKLIENQMNIADDNGLITKGNYTYLTKDDKINILQTWPPSATNKAIEIDLNQFLRSYTQKFKSLDKVELSENFKIEQQKKQSVGAPTDPIEPPTREQLAPLKADKIVQTHILISNNKLYLFIQFKKWGIWVNTDPLNLKGIDEGTRVVVLDISDPTQPNTTSITDYDASFDIKSGTTNPVFFAYFNLEHRFRKLLDRLTNKKDAIYTIFEKELEGVGTENLHNNGVDGPRHQEGRTLLLEKLAKILPEEKMEEILPLEVHLSLDLNEVKGEQTLLTCKNLMTQDLQSSNILTSSFYIDQTKPDGLTPSKKGYLGKFYSNQVANDKIILFNERDKIRGNNDYFISTTLNLLNYDSNTGKTTLDQSINIDGIVPPNAAIYQDKTQPLSVLIANSYIYDKTKINRTSPGMLSYSRGQSKYLYDLSFFKKENQKYTPEATFKEIFQTPPKESRNSSIIYTQFFDPIKFYRYTDYTQDIHNLIKIDNTQLSQKPVVFNNAQQYIPISSKLLLQIDFVTDHLEYTLISNLPDNTFQKIGTPINIDKDTIILKNHLFYFDKIHLLAIPYLAHEESSKEEGFYLFKVDPTTGLANLGKSEHGIKFAGSCTGGCRNKKIFDRNLHENEQEQELAKNFHLFVLQGDSSKSFTDSTSTPSTFIYTITDEGMNVLDDHGQVLTSLTF